jgi:hypothetical protein
MAVEAGRPRTHPAKRSAGSGSLTGRPPRRSHSLSLINRSINSSLQQKPRRHAAVESGRPRSADSSGRQGPSAARLQQVRRPCSLRSIILAWSARPIVSTPPVPLRVTIGGTAFATCSLPEFQCPVVGMPTARQRSYSAGAAFSVWNTVSPLSLNRVGRRRLQQPSGRQGRGR